MRALVTGGTGFVGSHLVDELLQHDYDVKVLRRPNSNTSYIDGKLVSYVNGDITIEKTLVNAFQDVDVVFHVAATPHNYASRKKFTTINVDGTRNVMIACLKASVPRCVYMSSASIYGYPTILITEKFPLHPTTKYGKSKLVAEQIFFQYGKKHGIHTSAVRSSWITGPRARIPRLIKVIQNNTFFHVGSGDNLLSISDARDVASCLRLVAENDSANGQAYNVKSYDCTTRQFISTFAKYLSVPAPQKHLPYSMAFAIACFGELAWTVIRKGNPPISRHEIKVLGRPRVLDTKKAQTNLGYHPRFTCDNSVKDTVSWFNQNGNFRM
jgi:nucleoside-diphosphate-sugar epimerase